MEISRRRCLALRLTCCYFGLDYCRRCGPLSGIAVAKRRFQDPVPARQLGAAFAPDAAGAVHPTSQYIEASNWLQANNLDEEREWRERQI